MEYIYFLMKSYHLQQHGMDLEHIMLSEIDETVKDYTV